MSAGIIGNVSFFLFSRQCRYYSLAIFFTVLLAFQYYFRDNRKRTLISISITSILLLSSNYLNYAAAYGCLALDYLIWGRKERALGLKELSIVFIPQFILGGLLSSLYNPIGKGVQYVSSVPWIQGKLMLLFWNFRELNSCEFGAMLFLLTAPFLYLFVKNRWLIRAPLTIFFYVFFIALFSPQKVSGPYLMPAATVRYLAPIIPLCIFSSVINIKMLAKFLRSRGGMVVLCCLLFFTNILNGGELLDDKTNASWAHPIARGRTRSTVYDFIHELFYPNKSMYSAVSSWIRENVKDKESIASFPAYATYPLMYHAPGPLYAWQLKEKEGQFSDLSDINFRGGMPPEYIIGFGPHIGQARFWMRQLEERQISYKRVKRITIYWYDLIRPELYWHSFYELNELIEGHEDVFIYKRI